MKIGIITFHKSLNYGSALQAYALVCQLRSMGHEPEIIDYEPHNYDAMYRIIVPPFSLEALKHDFVNLSFYTIMKNRKKSFDAFRKTNLPLTSKTFRYGEDISELDDMYDLLICGSDQIWNTGARDFDIAFFMPFSQKTPCISYAVSLNRGELEKFTDANVLRKQILRFKALSVRETSGKEKIEKFINHQREVCVVLDPTLLHFKDTYLNLSEKRCIQDKYLFFYSINYAPDAVEAALYFSRTTSLPVYTLVANDGTRSLLKIKKRKNIQIVSECVGPEDFLSMVRYAEHVVTNSFHGTAFSIIFEKSFYAIKVKNTSGKLVCDPRLQNILEFLGIQNRYLTRKELETFDLSETIDYASVNEKRKEQIQVSVDYLTSAISTIASNRKTGAL